MIALLSHPYLISCLATFILSLIFTSAMITVNITDIPVERSSHSKPTPKAGGVAVVTSFFIGAWVLFFLIPPPFDFSWHTLGLVVGALALGAALSLFDDIKHVAYRIRLLAQTAIAVVFVSVGLKIQCPPLAGMVGLPFVEFLLTLLFIVFVTNAANFVDGLNGLLSGSILVALPFMIATTLFSPGMMSSDYWIILICMILFPAISGFYLYNFPRGRIFIGDVGSVFIGLMIGIIALIGQKGHPEQPSWMFVHTRLFLLIYPLGFLWFDPVFTVVRRYFLGRSPFEPNRDFLFHILNRAGYSHVTVSLIHYLSVLILGSLSLLTPFGYMSFLALVGVYLGLQGLYVLWVLRVAARAGLKL
jgi:UDP-GlcNAc:undecaprenyl-phosphate GlcNAc-1-phosphate transferase